MDRTSVIHRSSEKFTGKVASLTAHTVRKVDELYIMSSAADRVLEQADNLIDPGNPWGKLINSFSSRRYQKGIELMGSKAIGFDKNQGLNAILKHGKQSQTRAIIGEERNYEPFAMSFKQLIDAYDGKESSATEQLERLELCVGGFSTKAKYVILIDFKKLNEFTLRLFFRPLRFGLFRSGW